MLYFTHGHLIIKLSNRLWYNMIKFWSFLREEELKVKYCEYNSQELYLCVKRTLQVIIPVLVFSDQHKLHLTVHVA